ncbi:MAG: hypothetical protein L6R37_004489 [Teloschistes peruensis]|nr:MAG: hypothetical protein L6R37_004489 [Teloschistes peruensis]
MSPLPQAYHHPSPLETLIPHLIPLLPNSLPLLRRIQFQPANSAKNPAFPNAHVFATFSSSTPPPPPSPPPPPPPPSHTSNPFLSFKTPPEQPPFPFAAAWVDRSRAPETECWIFSTYETGPEHGNFPTAFPPPHQHPVANEKIDYTLRASPRAEEARRGLLAVLNAVARGVAVEDGERKEEGEEEIIVIGSLHTCLLPLLTSPDDDNEVLFPFQRVLSRSRPDPSNNQSSSSTSTIIDSGVLSGIGQATYKYLIPPPPPSPSPSPPSHPPPSSSSSSSSFLPICSSNSPSTLINGLLMSFSPEGTSTTPNSGDNLNYTNKSSGGSNKKDENNNDQDTNNDGSTNGNSSAGAGASRTFKFTATKGRKHHRDLPIVMTSSTAHTKPMKPEDVGKMSFKLNTKYRPADEDGQSPVTPKPGKRGGTVLRHGSDDSSTYGGGEVGGPKSAGGGGGGGGQTLRFITNTTGATGRGKSAASSIAGGNGARGKNYSTTIFSGSKIKHLKKPDGVPLWRKDIQFDFLAKIFEDTAPVFTNSYDGKKEQTFADVYIDAMARSSKTSKILRDKLLTERKNALNMAMVCLLVNLGRMNTTLNFFPEMKAQLRTYHAIPSLQTYTDQNAYKQLQDAPRLKSILKGACEDRKEPLTIEHLTATPVPRTNPINLVFLLSTYAPKITETHFPPDVEFHDLVMRSTLSSESRAKAFLWLMWWYLESDFSVDDVAKNPYGQREDSGKEIKVPPFVTLSPEEEEKENVDTIREIEYGEKMQEERKSRSALWSSNPNSEWTNTKLPSTGYINVNETNAALTASITKPPKSGKKMGLSTGDASPITIGSPEGEQLPILDTWRQKVNVFSPTSGSIRLSSRSKTRNADSYYSDSDRTRSVSPTTKRKSMTTVTRVDQLLNDLEPRSTPAKPRGKPGPKPGGAGNTEKGSGLRITLKHKHMHIDPITGSLVTARNIAPSTNSTPGERGPKPRPLTAHQVAVAENRRERAEHLINRKLRILDRKKRKQRRQEGVFVRTWSRIKHIEDPFVNSDEETASHSNNDFHSSGMRFDEDGNLILVGTEPKDLYHAPADAERDELFKLNVIEANAVLNKRNQHHPPKYLNGTNRRGCAGLVSRDDEEDDYGEETMAYAAAIRRTQRRLDRWEELDRLKAAGYDVSRSGKGKVVDDSGNNDRDMGINENGAGASENGNAQEGGSDEEMEDYEPEGEGEGEGRDEDIEDDDEMSE